MQIFSSRDNFLPKDYCKNYFGYPDRVENKNDEVVRRDIVLSFRGYLLSSSPVPTGVFIFSVKELWQKYFFVSQKHIHKYQQCVEYLCAQTGNT